jgi:hypothetical protein
VASPAYQYAHQKARARLLADSPPCVHCGSPEANVADHQPPISLHDHVEGSGCCELVPSCTPCSHRQAGELGGALTPERRPPVVAPLWEEPLDGIGIDDPCWDVPWLVDLIAEMPASASWPRFMSAPHPEAIGSWGEDWEAWVAEHRRDVAGRPIRPRWWQRLAMRRFLEYRQAVDEWGDEILLPCWPEALMSVARQVGKSWIFQNHIPWRLTRSDIFGVDGTALLFARDLPVCWEIQRPIRRWAQDAEGWHSTASNGKEMVEYQPTANRWLLKAEQSIYGSTGHCGVFGDEVWDIVPATINEGVMPTLAEVPAGQIMLTSTAHRKATALYPGRRRAAIEDLRNKSDVDRRTLILEWSAHRDLPIGDVDTWRRASPHWSPTREDVIRKALRSAQSGESDDVNEPDPMVAFSTQWLNSWPQHQARKAEKGEPFLEDGTWGSILRICSPVDGAVFAIEDYFGEGVSAGWAGEADDGRIVVGARSFETRAEAYDFIADQLDGVRMLLVGGTLITDPDLRSMTTAVKTAGQSETRAGLSKLRELIGSDKLWQDGSPDLAEQLVVARVRQGDTGLAFVPTGRSDALRCALWAALEFDSSRGLAPAIH